MKVLHCFPAVLLAVLLCAATLTAQRPIPELTIAQVDFLRPFEQHNSTSAICFVRYQPEDALVYLNVTGRIPGGGSTEWIVRNLPLMPEAIAEDVSTWFDLRPFGISDGVDLTSLEIAWELSDSIWSTRKSLSDWDLVAVDSATYDVGDGIAIDTASLSAAFRDPTPAYVPKPAVGGDDKPIRYADMPNIQLNAGLPEGMSRTGYAGDINACGPAAVANAMKWMGERHQAARVDQTDRGRLVELSGLMNREPRGAVTDVQLCQGTLRYIRKYKLDVEVAFQSRFMKAKSNIVNPEDKTSIARNDNAANNAYPTWDWICDQMKKGGVVEIMFLGYRTEDDFKASRDDPEGQKKAKTRRYAFAHVVVVTGVASTKAGRKLYFKDDQNQPANEQRANDKRQIVWRDTRESVVTWSDADGIPTLTSDEKHRYLTQRLARVVVEIAVSQRFIDKDKQLSVDLIGPELWASSNRVYLSWRTASETDNSGFEVQRARAGDSLFKPVASHLTTPALAGLGTSSAGRGYNLVDGADGSLVPGETYLYRLVDVATDGLRTTHPAQAITLAADGADNSPWMFRLKSLLPNPARDHLTISFQLAEEDVVTVTLFTNDGRQVATPIEGRSYAPGVHYQVIDIEGLAPGHYMVWLTALRRMRVKSLIVTP